MSSTLLMSINWNCFCRESKFRNGPEMIGVVLLDEQWMQYRVHSFHDLVRRWSSCSWSCCTERRRLSLWIVVQTFGMTRVHKNMLIQIIRESFQVNKKLTTYRSLIISGDHMDLKLVFLSFWKRSDLESLSVIRLDYL